MRRFVFLPVAVVALAGVVAYMALASEEYDGGVASIFGIKIPPGYRTEVIPAEAVCRALAGPVGRDRDQAAMALGQAGTVQTCPNNSTFSV